MRHLGSVGLAVALLLGAACGGGGRGPASGPSPEGARGDEEGARAAVGERLEAVDPGAGTPERRASEHMATEGLARLEAGDRAGAARRLQDAIRVDPTNGRAYLHLARLRAAEGRREEALGLLERARELLRPYPEWRSRADSLAAALRAGG